MPERDPYDFSALAPDFSELEDDLNATPSTPSGGLGAIGFDDDEFEAEMERLASEEEGLALSTEQLDAQFETLKRVLADLNETIVDQDLDAEEAWLEGLLTEDDDASP